MLRPGWNARIFLILLLGGVFAVLPAHGQEPPLRIPQTQAPPPLGAGPDREQQHMLRKMAEERNVDRQKEIVAETDELLALAKKLKEQVAKSNKDQLSVDVVDTAAQIEKLAKTVKERMRDGT